MRFVVLDGRLQQVDLIPTQPPNQIIGLFLGHQFAVLRHEFPAIIRLTCRQGAATENLFGQSLTESMGHITPRQDTAQHPFSGHFPTRTDTKRKIQFSGRRKLGMR